MARFGDRVGWTLTDYDDFVFSYDESRTTYFHSFERGDPPTVGAIITITTANQLPLVHSIAVRLDISEYR